MTLHSQLSSLTVPPSPPTLQDSARFALASRGDNGTRATRTQPGRQLRARRPPPRDYYANNLRQLLAFLRWRFAERLDPRLQTYIEQVEQLPGASARLLARLLTRKGPVFRPSEIRYAEVADTQVAIHDLVKRELVQKNQLVAADTLLAKVRLAELKAWFPQVASKRKSTTIATLLHRYSDAQLRSNLQQHMGWLTLGCVETHRACLRLYFGDSHQDMSAFVIEDLGLMKYPDYRLSAPDWLTDDGQCLAVHEQLHRYARLSHQLGRQQDQHSLAELLAEKLNAMTLSREQQQIRDRALLRIGAHLEQQGHLRAALVSYGGTTRAPATERQVRICHKLNEPARAQTLLQRMQAKPASAAEMDFATHFGKRRHNSHAVTELCLLGPTPKAIEACAARLLQTPGGRIWHLENQLPLGIAGLLYWDAIYADLPGLFTRPFQQAPNDLYWPDFAALRGSLLSELEARWLRGSQIDPDAWVQQLYRSYRAHEQTANPLVNWRLFDLSFIGELTTRVPAAALARLGGFMIRELNRFRSGFPDLLVTNSDGSFEFVEVKGPTDQLQGNQRLWLQRLSALQLPARVLKLRADTSAPSQ